MNSEKHVNLYHEDGTSKIQTVKKSKRTNNPKIGGKKRIENFQIKRCLRDVPITVYGTYSDPNLKMGGKNKAKLKNIYIYYLK